MDSCGLPVDGGLCKRFPGHGGRCFNGVISPVVPDPETFLPTIPGTLIEFYGVWDRKRWVRRLFRAWRVRNAIKAVLINGLLGAQLFIDIIVLAHRM